MDWNRYVALIISLLMLTSMVLIISFPVQAQSSDPVWLITTVDEDTRPSHNDITIDSEGKPHIIYLDDVSGNGYEDTLKHAYYDGEEWIVSTVGPAGTGHVSIADFDDEIHIAYTLENNSLGYGILKDGSWTLSYVGSSDVQGSSIAINSSGNPHISFSHANKPNEVKHASHDGLSWVIETVYPKNSYHTQIALDSEDRPHIVHRTGSKYVVHTSHNGSGWNSIVVDISDYSLHPSYQAIDIDDHGKVHLAYVNATGDQWSDRYLKGAVMEGGQWTTSVIDPEPVSIGTVSLVADQGLHVFYLRTGMEYWYGHNDGISWDLMKVTGEGTTAAMGSMAVDQDGWPQVSMTYRTVQERELRHGIYGEYHAPGFTSTPSDGQAGRFYEYVPTFDEDDVEITANMTNAPFLEWDGEAFRGTPGNFEHGEYWIYLEALSTQGKLKSEQNETFFIYNRWTISDTGLFPSHYSPALRASMDLDSKDRPHISYSDPSENLRYSYWTGDSWIDTPRNDSVSVSKNIILLDQNDDVHIVYLVGTELIYERYDGTWRTPETVSLDVDRLADLAFLSDGRPAVAFNEGLDVIFSVRQSNGTWEKTIVEEGTNSNVYSFTVDDDGDPHMTTMFSNSTIWQMRYHYQDHSTGTWYSDVIRENTVEGGSSIGYDASIGVDIQGRVHVAYIEHQSTLWYSILEEGTWTHDIIQDDYVVHQISLALDDEDFPRITYYNAFFGQLRYATWNGSDWNIEIVDGYRIVDGTSDAVGRSSTLKLSDEGLPHVFYYDITNTEYKYAKLEQWEPVFLNAPMDARVGDHYEYRPQFDEKSVITGEDTNAPFLTWDGEAFTGVPEDDHTGDWWINISAESVYGGLSSYQNTTFTIKDYHAPQLTATHEPHSGQVGEHYLYRMEANESVDWNVNTDAGFLHEASNGYLRLEGTPQAGDEGSYAVNISATSLEGLLTTYENFTLNIKPRWAPEFKSEPVIAGTEGSIYSYTVTVNESVEWVPMQSNANFLQFYEDNRTVHGQLPMSPGSSYYINLTATSVEGKATAHQNYTLTITDGWSPHITSSAEPLETQVTSSLQYTAVANESVTWSMQSDAAFITQQTDGVFSIDPEKGDEGEYHLNITATSVNGYRSSYLNLSLTVLGLWEPDWTDLGDWTGEETFGYHQSLMANESVDWQYEGDFPYSLNVITDGVFFNITGTPDIGDAGSYYINVTAYSVSGKLEKNHNFTFDIHATPIPEFTSEPPGSVVVDGQYYYKPTFLNVSDDEFGFETDSSFLSWNEHNEVVGEPGIGEIGTWYVNISVTLAVNDQTSYQNYSVTVYGWQPVIGPSPPDARMMIPYEHLFEANETVVWYWHFNMPGQWEVDHDPLNLTLSGIPDGPAGDYYFNVTATSVNGGMSETHNHTITITSSWAPTLINTSPNGVLNQSYTFTPQFNESAIIVLAETNAPFLSWNEEEQRFEGTPTEDHTGDYWIRIKAVSENGTLESDDTLTFTVPDEGDTVCFTPFALFILIGGMMVFSKRIR